MSIMKKVKQDDSRGIRGRRRRTTLTGRSGKRLTRDATRAEDEEKDQPGKCLGVENRGN